MSRTSGWTAALLALATLGMAWTARLPDAGPGWRVAFVALALGGPALVWAGSRGVRSAGFVLAVALGLRLIVLPLPPTLSDDGFRYVWDGVISNETAYSPFDLRPSDPRLARFQQSEVFQRMNSRDVYSVYPPVSQALFRVAGAWGLDGWRTGWSVYKLLLVLVEGLGLLALSRRIPPAALALVAWHPVLVVEGAGQGHTDVLLVGAIGMVLWAVGRRPAAAGAALALAVLTKLWPVGLAPFVLRRAGRRGLAAFGVLTAALGAPMVVGGRWSHVAESLRLYAGHFDFYSAPFLILKGILYPGLGEGGAGPLAAFFLSGVWGLLLLSLWMVDDGSPRRFVRSLAAGVVGYALLSPTQHPWHWAAVFVVCPLLKHKKELYWLASISPATYLLYTHGAAAYGMALWLGWGGAALILMHRLAPTALQGVLRRRGEKKWDRIRSTIGPISPGSRIQDLGCGEGYVGEAAARDSGCALDLSDVLDVRQSARPLTPPEALAGSSGATFVVFVLHHAADPQALLRKAASVTDGPVVVWETVWRWPWARGPLEALDRAANALRSGGQMAGQPTAHRSPADWEGTFKAMGFQVRSSSVWGWLHPQALWVLVPPGGSPATVASTESEVAVRASSQTAPASRRNHVN